MQFRDGGATGSNGRDSRNGPPSGTRPSPETPEGSGGAHGSLMQRYRGTGAAPPPGTEARSAEVNPPLPPPRPADPAENPAPTGAERAWDEPSRTWTPATAPAAPTPGTGPPTGAGRSAVPATSPGTGSGPATDSGPAPDRDTSSGTGTSPGTGTAAPGAGGPAGPASASASAGTATAPGTAPGASTPGSSTSAGSRTAQRTGSAGTPGTGPGTAQHRSGAGDGAAVTVTRGVTPGTGTSTLSAERAAEFRGRWRDLQSDFVDDPQQAVRDAGALAREVLDALAAEIADKQRVDGWRAGEGSGTEHLRLALRQYRSLVDKLLEL